MQVGKESTAPVVVEKVLQIKSSQFQVSQQGFPNSGKGWGRGWIPPQIWWWGIGNFAGGNFFDWVVRAWGGVILTIWTFFKANSILWILIISIAISMACVSKECEIKTMVQEQWLQLKMKWCFYWVITWKFLFSGGGIDFWWEGNKNVVAGESTGVVGGGRGFFQVEGGWSNFLLVGAGGLLGFCQVVKCLWKYMLILPCLVVDSFDHATMLWFYSSYYKQLEYCH